MSATELGKTERYMVIFNDKSLTIKGYYNEPITLQLRKKILDRLYSLIHMELFEGKIQNEPVDSTLPEAPPPQTEQPLITSPEPPKEKKKHDWRKYYKYKKKRKKIREEKAIEPELEEPEELAPDIDDTVPHMSSVEDTNSPDPSAKIYDNEKDDNQYAEFKKKGMI